MTHAEAARDYERICEALKEQGWWVERTAVGHYRALAPNRAFPPVHFSKSGDPRAIRNTISMLKKGGFEWPPAAEVVKLPRPRRSQPPDPVDLETEDALSILARESEDSPERPTAEAPSPASASAPPPSVDDLFARLRAARDEHELARLHLSECEEAARKANEAMETARAERERAAERMREAKKAFDAAFEEGSL